MRRLVGTTAVTVTLAGLFGHAAATWGQHDHGGGQAQGIRRRRRARSSFEKVVGEGRGFGLAFAADQNGYPGPMHVLELKDRLKLTAETRSEVRLVHLLTHLKTRDLLTEDQRRIYHEARWGVR